MKNTKIVLVHGAFADGSGWGDVIHLLTQRGFEEHSELVSGGE